MPSVVVVAAEIVSGSRSILLLNKKFFGVEPLTVLSVFVLVLFANFDFQTFMSLEAVIAHFRAKLRFSLKLLVDSNHARTKKMSSAEEVEQFIDDLCAGLSVSNIEVAMKNMAYLVPILEPYVNYL